MKRNFEFLADLYPPKTPTPCPRCKGGSYVFGIPNNNPSKEVLACTQCGFLFHYPCPACGKDTAELIAREEKCFSYRCQSCQHAYQKPPGWLERPPYFQEKLYSYQLNQKSIEERALEALQSRSEE